MKESSLNIYKCVSVIFILSHLVGWAMYKDSLGWLMHAYALTVLVAFTFVVLCNKNSYVSNMRFVLFGVYGLAMSITTLVLFNDASGSYGPDIGAMLVRGIVLLVLGILAKEAILNNAKEKNT